MKLTVGELKEMIKEEIELAGDPRTPREVLRMDTIIKKNSEKIAQGVYDAVHRKNTNHIVQMMQMIYDRATKN
jgi:hypothetical protein